MKLINNYLQKIIKFVLAAVVSIVLGLLAYNYTYNLLTGIIERSLIEIAKQGAKTIENDINWHLKFLSMVSEFDSIKDRDTPFSEKIKILQFLKQTNEDNDFGIIDLSGHMFSPSGQMFDVSSEELFIRALKGERVISVPEKLLLGDETTVAFSVPIYSGEKVIGVLCDLHSSGMYNDIVKKITFDNQGYGYIIDNYGTTIAHNDYNLVRNKNSIFDEVKINPEIEQFARIAKDMADGKTGSGHYKYNGQEKIMGYTKISNAPWSVAVSTLRSNAFYDVYPMLVFVIIVTVVFGLILVFINVFFASTNRKLKREEQSFKNAVETANIIIISFLEDGTIININKNAEQRFGYKSQEIVKTVRIYELLKEKDQAKMLKVVNECKSNKLKPDNVELCIITSNGGCRHIVFSLRIIDDIRKENTYELMGIDITDRVKSEIELMEKHEELTIVYEELAASEEELKSQLDELIHQKLMLQEKDERHNLVVEASNIGLWDWDVTSNTYTYSDKWYEILGIEKREYKGKENNWKDFVFADDFEYVSNLYWQYLEKKIPSYECEYRIITPKKEIRWLHSVGKALWDDDGRLLKMAGAHTDITSKKEAEEKINKLAYCDALTGLPNRSQLFENFQAIALKAEGCIAFILIDINNFKLINDSYGHVIGDKLLIEVSIRIKELCAEKMHLSRLGGDEYAVMVWDYGTLEALTQIVEGFVHNLDGLLRIEDYNISLSTSMGISLYPTDADNFDDLMKNADTAMFKASERHRKYAYYKQEMNNAIVERLNLRNSLKLALVNREFMLCYQPQYRAKDKKVIGFEALVRWRSETLGMVSPDKFIPVAEESGIIISLGNWILEEAISFLKKIHQNGHDYMIMSINISVIQLTQRNFSETVLRLIDEYELSPKSLELEITESVMMESVEAVVDNITNLRREGVQFALDDFGTGYSSLNYLTKLPIDTLKIDKSFIDGIGSIKDQSLLVSTIIDIGRKLGLKVVAEGVETEQQYNYLSKRRCERIQGYYFSKPLYDDAVMEMLKSINEDELDATGTM